MFNGLTLISYFRFEFVISHTRKTVRTYNIIIQKGIIGKFVIVQRPKWEFDMNGCGSKDLGHSRCLRPLLLIM